MKIIMIAGITMFVNNDFLIAKENNFSDTFEIKKKYTIIKNALRDIYIMNDIKGSNITIKISDSLSFSLSDDIAPLILSYTMIHKGNGNDNKDEIYYMDDNCDGLVDRKLIVKGDSVEIYTVKHVFTKVKIEKLPQFPELDIKKNPQDIPKE